MSRGFVLFLIAVAAVSSLPNQHGTAALQPVSSSPAAGQNQDMADPWGDDWKCGQPVPLTPELLKAIDFEDPHHPFAGYSGGDRLPPFLISVFEPVSYGAVLFVNENGVWHAYALQEGGEAYAVYVSPNHASAVIFAMWTREGPGQDYTVLSTNDGFRSRSCAVVPRPTSLYTSVRVLDYMAIEDFNADPTGNAALVGRVDFRDGEIPGSVRWYRTSTPHLGANWRTPHRIPGKPKPLPGIYTKVEHQNLQALIDSLHASAGRR